jgi:hypothetical protein
VSVPVVPVEVIERLCGGIVVGSFEERTCSGHRWVEVEVEVRSGSRMGFCFCSRCGVPMCGAVPGESVLGECVLPYGHQGSHRDARGRAIEVKGTALGEGRGVRV